MTYDLESAIQDYKYIREDLGFKCIPLYPKDPNDPDNKKFKSNMILKKQYAFPYKWNDPKIYNEAKFNEWYDLIDDKINNNEGVLYAVLTGKINNITVFDLDIVKAKNRNEEFEKLVQSAETFQVSTPKGEHHYFLYSPYLKSKIGFLGYVDILNDTKSAVGAGVLRDDGFYSILDEHTLKPMSKELFEFIPDNLKQMIDSQPKNDMSMVDVAK